MAVGDVVTPPLVTTGTADEDGSFTLRAGASPELVRLAEINNGYVNFVLRTPEGGEWHFSRYVGDSPAQRHAHEVRWTERPNEPASPLEIRLPSAPLRAGARSGICRDYQVIKTERQSTKIGEINAESDTVRNQFVYAEGNSADSDISVALRPGGGGWQLAGTHHVGTEKVGRVGHTGGANESFWFTSGFDYHLMRDKCGNEKVVVHQWRGGMENHPQTNPGCTVFPYSKFADRYDSGATFHRSENRAITWTNAARVFGASLTSRSGFSRYVQMTLKFGPAGAHLVCGDNAVGMKSDRVFSGNSSPI